LLGLSLAFSPASQRNSIFEAGAVTHYGQCPAHWGPHLFKACWYFNEKTAPADRVPISKYLHEGAGADASTGVLNREEELFYSGEVKSIQRPFLTEENKDRNNGTPSPK